VSKKVTKPTPEMAPCHFCKKDVRKDDAFCSGCNHVVCENCEADPVNQPMGRHRVEDHAGG
jgi:hypothetical protein